METILDINQWIIFSLFFFAILSLIGISGLLLYRFKVSENTSRRVVHIGVGLMVSISPFLFNNALPAIVLAVTFILLNWLALKKDRAKGMHSTDRPSFGTVYFPVSFLLLILLFWYRDPGALIVGMLLMAISDPLASFVGESYARNQFFIPWSDKKSIIGSLTAFLSNFVITLILIPLLYETKFSLTSIILTAIIVAIVGTLAEIISKEGTDNLTLPLFSALILNLSLHQPIYGKLWVLFWIFFALGFAGLAYRGKSLSLSGMFGAMAMGAIIFSIGGMAWMLPMAAFFILSTLISKIGKTRKKLAALMAEKHDVRDIYQVYANGGVGFFLSIGFYFTQDPIFYYAYLAALGAAAADTWATEFGTLLGKRPRKITNLKLVSPGESGGITIAGTVASLGGALSIVLTGIIFMPDIYPKQLLFIVMAGFFGALIDSLIGATVQAKYQCPHCKKITEKRHHCKDYNTELIAGISWINNDFVNLMCTASGALIAILLVHFWG